MTPAAPASPLHHPTLPLTDLLGDPIAGELVRLAPFLERARNARDLGEAADAHLALGGYLAVRVAERALEPGAPSDEVRWQVQAIRRHLEELQLEHPEAQHLTRIVEAAALEPEDPDEMRLRLLAYGHFLEHEARFGEALTVLELLVRSHPDGIPAPTFGTYGLLLARLNRLLSRWEAAVDAYQATQRVARRIGDRVLELRAELGVGAVDRGRGNLPAALARAQAMARTAQAEGLALVEAMAYQDMGAAYSQQGRALDGITANFRAYQCMPDPAEQMRVLGDIGTGLRELGIFDVARLALAVVARTATAWTLRTNAALELMDIESTLRQRVPFERARAALTLQQDRMGPSMRADFCMKAGIGLVRFGQRERGRQLLEEGRELAERCRLHAWFFRFVEVLEAHDGREVPVAVTPAATHAAVRDEGDATSVLTEMRDQLAGAAR